MGGMTYLVDGLALDDPSMRWRLEDATQLPAGATRRVSVLELPSVDGVVSARRGVGTGTVTLSVAVLSLKGRRDELDERRSFLVGHIREAQELTLVRASGEKRIVDVVSVDVAEPVRRSERVLLFKAVFTVAPFWRGDKLVESSWHYFKDEKELDVVFPEFDGCTGTISDGELVISAPYSSVSVTDLGSGTGFILPEVETGQWFVRFILVTGEAVVRSSNSFLHSKVDYPPTGLLQLRPKYSPKTGNTQIGVHVSVQGATSNTATSLQAHRWYT